MCRQHETLDCRKLRKQLSNSCHRNGKGVIVFTLHEIKPCPVFLRHPVQKRIYSYILSLQLKSAPSRKNDKDSASMSKTTTPSKTPMEDKEITEKKRLRILEQTLSQKLRLSNARRQIGKESGSIRKEIGKKSGTSSLLQREERASSDSELIVKRNVSPRGLTPPVELVGGSHLDEEDGGLRTQLMVNMFKDNHKLQKVKRIQVRIIWLGRTV